MKKIFSEYAKKKLNKHEKLSTRISGKGKIP